MFSGSYPFRYIVYSMNCLSGKLRFRVSGNCRFGKLDFGELSFHCIVLAGNLRATVPVYYKPEPKIY